MLSKKFRYVQQLLVENNSFNSLRQKINTLTKFKVSDSIWTNLKLKLFYRDCKLNVNWLLIFRVACPINDSGAFNSFSDQKYIFTLKT